MTGQAGVPGVTVDDLLQEARTRLRDAPHDIETREASLLICHLLGWSEAQVRARGDQTVDGEVASKYRRLVERRAQGEPTAYLLGEREFYGRPFRVDPRVLIPRPETEHIIEIALELDLPPEPQLLDLGSGSGCLAVTLAAELPTSRVVAVDLSPGALALTAGNARLNGVEGRLLAVGSDLAMSLLPQSFDLVVSNPPYVSLRELPDLSPQVTEHEPHLALFAPLDGRSVIARILRLAQDLRPGVQVLIEIGYDQADWLRLSVERMPWVELLEIRPDLAGIPRIGVLRRC